MSIAPGRLTLLFLCCLLTLPLAGCAGKDPAVLPLGQGENLYVDAELEFAMEHPANWSRVRGRRQKSTVRWQGPNGREGKDSPEAVVISLPPPSAIGGKDRLAENYLSAHPQRVFSGQADRELPAAPALQMRALSPERQFLIFFLTTRNRAFILEFSAPPVDFDRYLPLFEEMAESFQTFSN